MLKAFFDNRRQQQEQRQAAHQLLVALVEAARHPAWFTELQVDDNFDGRFDLVTLHVSLALHRLKSLGPDAHRFQAFLVEAYTADLEFGLREMGVSDSGLNHKVKKLLGYFYGRIDAYEKAISEESLDAALRRNLWRETEEDTIDDHLVQRAISHVKALRQMLSQHELPSFVAGEVAFFAP